MSIDCSANSGTASYALAVYTGTSTGVFVTNQSRVGIGTATPSQMLDIYGNITVDNGTIIIEDTGQQLQFGDSNVAIDRSGNDIVMHGYSGHIFTRNGGESMRIDSSGSVGIGTDAPSSQLNVYAALNQQFHHYTSGLYTAILALGRVKGGTSLLEIKYDSAGAENAYISRAYTNATLHFDKQGTDHMTILGDGNVGINDSSPTYKLDVNGTSRFTGVLRVDTGINHNGTTILNSSRELINIAELAINAAAAGTYKLYCNGTANFSGNVTLGPHCAVGNGPNASWDSSMHSLQIAHSMSLFCETTDGADRNSIIGSNVYYNSGYKRMYTDETCSILLRSNYISFRTDNSGTANVTFTPTEVAKISPGVLTMTGDVTPSADATYDLGHTSSLDWNVLYIRTIDMYNQRLMLSTSAEMVTFKDHVTVGQGTQFYARNTPVMRVGDASGNARVGIGTASPAGQLHVYDDFAGERNLYFDNHNASAVMQLNIRAGTTNEYLSLSRSTTQAAIMVAGNPLYIKHYHGGAWHDSITVDSAGEVGINRSDPSYNLDVNGTGRFTGQLTLGTGIIHGSTTILNSSRELINIAELAINAAALVRINSTAMVMQI